MVVTLRARFQFIGGQTDRDLSCTSCSSNKMYVINLQSCLFDSFWMYSFFKYGNHICMYINAIANSVM